MCEVSPPALKKERKKEKPPPSYPAGNGEPLKRF
jgi:hypothetical protein